MTHVKGKVTRTAKTSGKKNAKIRVTKKNEEAKILTAREILTSNLPAESGGAAVVQWNHACFGVRGVSKRTGSNPAHGLSVGWASSLGATVS
ncbi:hypothetical protein E2C01_057070 [Portunus trituberculatus]|uniref:Uncharacterized protein n=1 Tax=Portunus trituberculatus TaxID=210409 RepID=A0A5B7H1C2_PORTR|nr:hypothetical protein [Portunus trituberculatus]